MENLNEASLLELLDLYMDMVEKQDEVICRLGRIVSRQAQDILHYKNIYHIEEEENRVFQQDKALAKEALSEYESTKLEP